MEQEHTPAAPGDKRIELRDEMAAAKDALSKIVDDLNSGATASTQAPLEEEVAAPAIDISIFERRVKEIEAAAAPALEREIAAPSTAMSEMERLSQYLERGETVAHKVELTLAPETLERAHSLAVDLIRYTLYELGHLRAGDEGR